MTVAVLKSIAMLSMLSDHLGFTLRSISVIDYTMYIWMRSIGRIAFVIYAFLIGEGLAHTRSKVRYLQRLWLCACVSSIPYSLLCGSPLSSFPLASALVLLCFCLIISVLLMKRQAELRALMVIILLSCVLSLPEYSVCERYLFSRSLNTLYTLALGASCTAFLERGFFGEHSAVDRGCYIGLSVSLYLLMAHRVSFGGLGVALVMGLACLHKARWMQVLTASGWCFIEFWPTTAQSLRFLVFSLLGVALIAFYRGKPGHSRLPKRFFYWFYPVHLLVLAGIRWVFTGITLH